MTFPAIFLGFLIATLYGSAFHIIKGGGFSHLLLFVVIAWVGFWAGHYGGNALGLGFFRIGPLNAGMATIGSLLLLLIGEWLSRVEVYRR